MKNKINIKRLAELSHILVSPEEQMALEKDMSSILSYVEQVTEISSKIDKKETEHRNVMRDDGEPHPTGVHTKDLLHEAPLVADNYIEVKKIINQDS